MSASVPEDSTGGPVRTSLRIEEAAALLAAIVASSTDAILSKNLDGIVTSWNAASERLFGYSAADMVGRSIRCLIPPDRQREEDAILRRIAAGERIDNYETVRLCADGRPIDVEVTISPVRDVAGTIVGASKIVRDVTDRKRAQERASLLSAIVNSSSDGIISKSLTGIVTSWNHSAERIFGYLAAEMVGRPIRRLIPADRQAEEDEILRRIALGETVEAFETIRVRKNGERIDVSVTISPVLDPAGRVIGASKIVRDIGERKAAEERIRFLLSEVNHRSKNLLGLVQAIARQTATSRPDEFVSSFNSRLQALAANHDLLFRSDSRGTGLNDLIAVHFAPFVDLLGRRITTAGTDQLLNATAAQQLGMAFHELVTNAAKYGALANESGRIDISWECADDEFLLTWLESDGPAVPPTRRQGFGTRVLTGLIPASLQGTCKLAYESTGLTWRLRCPVRHVLEPTHRASHAT